ncbi:MAG: hypothetical protein ACK550_17515 [Synechococcaceae cyanobacterium]
MAEPSRALGAGCGGDAIAARQGWRQGTAGLAAQWRRLEGGEVLRARGASRWPSPGLVNG